MKIVHVIFSMTIGGAETMLVNIVNEQVRDNDVALIVVNRHYDTSLLENIDSKVKLILLNRKPGSKSPFFIVKFNYLLLQADVIHCHVANLVKFIFPILRKRSMLTVHHEIFKDNHDLRLYNKLFAISKTVKESINKHSGLDSSVVYNGVKMTEIQKKSDFSSKSIFRIIQVGRLTHRVKGQHLLLEAIGKIQDLKIELDIVGEGESEFYLRELVAKYSISEKVKFLGLQTPEVLNNMLHYYDLLVQPSLEEGFGLTIVEAMSAKLPVLVSSIPGPLEIVDNGKFGYVFESENINDLVDKIKEIHHNYINYRVQDKCDEAYGYCLNNYSIQNCVKSYLYEYSVS